MSPQQWRQESEPIADDIAQGLPYGKAVRRIQALGYSEQEAHEKASELFDREGVPI